MEYHYMHMAHKKCSNLSAILTVWEEQEDLQL